MSRTTIAALATLLLCAGPLAAQEPPILNIEPAPVMLPIDAVELGVQMEEAAPKKFRKWADSFAKENFYDDHHAAPTAEALLRAVEKRARRAPAESRLAGAFLVAYLGYEHGNKEQAIIASRVTELDRRIDDLEDKILLLESSPAPRNFRDPFFTATEAERARQRLEQFIRQRDFHRQLYDYYEPKVDACLRHLAVLYEQVKGVNPAMIRKLK